MEAALAMIPVRPGPDQIVHLVEAELEDAAAVLAVAFHDYAWTRWVIPEDGYGERLRQLQRLYLAHALGHGSVLRTADFSGVVALLPVAAPEPAPEVYERIRALHGDRLGRLGGVESPEPELPAAQALAAPLPAADWTLETVGVLSSAQGRGIGGRLVDAGLRTAQARGASAVGLETSDERNVALYRRHGFEVVAHQRPECGPQIWTLRAEIP
ncbi:GNAT family N-acetyltransferase [Brevibacterium sp.]|uniref:GNAT family N-acetyltransferase n=1 Tax=Brevibacterium sp. TaxID=1701 RepID=UPI0025BD3F81|nr:GNAT family N-acetyltransferase [Brevibacterium sp.]